MSQGLPDPARVETRRFLIVNADDFGQCASVNRGVVTAHERGIVTSASLMVRWPAAEDAATYGRSHPTLSLGLHVDLGEWVYRDEAWRPRYEVVALHDPSAVADEVNRQLAAFRELTGKDPTHLDSHQHVHLREPVRSILARVARSLAVPLRQVSAGIHFCGNFYGQDGKGNPLPEQISVAALIRTVSELRPGITELCCHPGETEDLDSPYRDERAQEVKVLCDPRVRAALDDQKVELRSFADLARLASGSFALRRDTTQG